MAFCRKCGAELRQGIRFCSQCGIDLKIDRKQGSTTSNSTMAIIVATAICLLSVGLLSGYFLISSILINKKETPGSTSNANNIIGKWNLAYCEAINHDGNKEVFPLDQIRITIEFMANGKFRYFSSVPQTVDVSFWKCGNWSLKENGKIIISSKVQPCDCEQAKKIRYNAVFEFWKDQDNSTRQAFALEAADKVCNPSDNEAFMGVQDIYYQDDSIRADGASTDPVMSLSCNHLLLKFKKAD